MARRKVPGTMTPGEGVHRKMKQCPECKGAGEKRASLAACGKSDRHSPHRYRDETTTSRRGRADHVSFTGEYCDGRPGTVQCGTCNGSGMVPR